jgi:transcriptional regulator with XRE-family HTH domain
MTEFASELKNSSVFAEEAFVVEVQSLLQTVMNEKGMSRADLASALGVSRARVTQIFSDECKNLTVRLLARAVFAMGDRVQVTSESHSAVCRRNKIESIKKVIGNSKNIYPSWEYSPIVYKQLGRDMEVANDYASPSVSIAGALRRRDEFARRVA